MEKHYYSFLNLSALLVGNFILFALPLLLFTGNSTGQIRESPIKKEEIKRLREKLKSSNTNFRANALIELKEMGRSAVPAIPELLLTLSDPDEKVCQGAVDTISRIGKAAPEIIPDLITDFQRSSIPKVRSGLALAFFQMDNYGEKSNPILSEKAPPVLLKVWGADKLADEELRINTAKALSSIIVTEDKRSEGYGSGVGSGSDDGLRAPPPEGFYLKKGIEAAINSGLIAAGDPNPVISLLAILEKKGDVWMRLEAIKALKIAAKDSSKDIVPEMIQVLINDPNPEVKKNIIEALGGLLSEAISAVPVLKKFLNHEDAGVRAASILALVQVTISEQSLQRSEIVPLAENCLRDPDIKVRLKAVEALGNMRFNPGVLDILLNVLKTHENAEIRLGASVWLGYENENEDRERITSAFFNSLNDADVNVRNKMVRELTDEVEKSARAGEIDRATQIMEILIDFLRKTSTSEDILTVSQAFTNLSESLLRAEDTSLNAHLITALPVLEIKLSTVPSNGVLSPDEFRRNLENLKRIQREKEWLSVSAWIDFFPRIAKLVFIAFILFLTWLAVYFLSPLSLLKIAEVIPLSGEVKLPSWLAVISFPLQGIISLFIFRDRVLDAWIQKHLIISAENFAAQQTVIARAVHVPIDVFLDQNKQPLTELEPGSIQKIFSQNQVRIVISGEGGAGKTSLACQFAKWAMNENVQHRLCAEHLMLPVLLEENLIEAGGENHLLKNIEIHLRDLAELPEPIFPILVKQLLKKKRILVVVDGLSEMNEKTYQSVLTGITEIPSNAVIITSRHDENLNRLNKTSIEPIKIEGNRLSSFVEGYLSGLGKKELFEDEEFFEGCKRISAIVGSRTVTVLIARLFVEQMIAQRENNLDDELPRNIPELMLQSIKTLHTKKPDDIAFGDVIKVSKVIAWECLKNEFRPLPADLERAKAAVGPIKNSEKIFEHLVNRLNLIEIISVHEKIRFKTDPLAEYLASLHLIDTNTYNEEKWRKFFDSVAKKGEGTKSFLLALHDCCFFKENQDVVPDDVIEQLSRHINSIAGKPIS